VRRPPAALIAAALAVYPPALRERYGPEIVVAVIAALAVLSAGQ
jgi:hypothetical protein